jgi:Fuc2NAc and GlcNAc transferase
MLNFGFDKIVLLLGIAATSLSSSFFVTYLCKVVALKKGVMDVPNSRSSHHLPTPRGGGWGIFFGVMASVCVLSWQEVIDLKLLLPFMGASIILATVSYLDDLQGLSNKLRLFVQFIVAMILLYGTGVFELAWYWLPLCLLYVVWSVNLFNFMDGIDGIAVQQLLSFGIGLVCLSPFLQSSLNLYIGIVLVFAALGFLYWNWAPAKIFMGDIGSTFIGLIIVFIGLYNFGNEGRFPYGILILSTLFNVEATVTLLSRVLKNENFFQAHRSHPYQILAAKFNSHHIVASFYLVANVGLILPIAIFSEWNRELASYSLIFCILIWGLMCLFLRGKYLRV